MMVRGLFVLTIFIMLLVPSASKAGEKRVAAVFYCDSKYQLKEKTEVLPFKLELLESLKIMKNGTILVSPARLRFDGRDPITTAKPFATYDGNWIPNFIFRDQLVKFEVSEQDLDAEIAWFKFGMNFLLHSAKDGWGGKGAKWTGICDQRQFAAKTKSGQPK